MTTTELKAAWDTATWDERNAMVAREVLGWVQDGEDSILVRPCWKPADGSESACPWVDCWNPVESIADAWVVVEKLDRMMELSRFSDCAWQCVLRGWFSVKEPKRGQNHVAAAGKTAPEAICLAALLATAEEKG